MARELSRRRVVPTVVTMLVLLVAGVPAAVGAPATPPERAETAAGLAKVIRLFSESVIWPDGSRPAGSALQFGVFGADPLSVAVAKGLDEIATSERMPPILRSEKPDDLKSCQVVFVYNPTQGQLDDLLALTAGRPVLTILFSEDRFAQGAMIELFNLSSGLRYFINHPQFRRAKISPTPGLLANMLKGRPR